MRRLGPLLALAATLACSAAVKGGLPPLVVGCQTTADCTSAGPAYQCVDAGCTILRCECNSDCPAGLACDTAPESLTDGGGECLAVDGGTPCGDGG